jgi:hypothetical protein
VRVTYKWDGGDPLSDELRLDLDLYLPLRRVERDTVHEVSKTLKEIVKRFDRWTAGHNGLLVLSPEEKRRRDLKEVAARREWRKRQAAVAGQPGMARRLLKTVGRLRLRRS